LTAFRLDRYEVTVGRFRQFLASYSAAGPAPGAGKNPNNAADPGWDPAWADELPPDAGALGSLLHCPTAPSWTDAAADNEVLPINCVDWYEAFAFCAWDGGRLPTFAEWAYTAAGGYEQRAYPWSNPATSLSIDPTRAVYDSRAPDGVGSRPAGDGRWGHSDLAGNVAEWLLDTPTILLPPQCNDCENPSPDDRRGFANQGYSAVSELSLANWWRGAAARSDRFDMTGLRCARPMTTKPVDKPPTTPVITPPTSSSMPIDQADYAQVMADLVCAELAPCCSKRRIPLDAARCKATELQYRNFYLTQYTATVNYDPIKAGECRDRTLAWTKACSEPTKEDLAVCNSVLTGKLTNQQACELDLQCAPGADGTPFKCKDFNNSKICLPDLPLPTGHEGEDCKNATLMCDAAAGLFCAPSGLCEPQRNVGGACTAWTDCATDALYCDDNTHLCTVRPATGMCPNSGACAVKAYCNDAFQCMPKLSDGSACQSNDHCLSGGCLDQVCGKPIYAPTLFCMSDTHL
jgi:formylglycine-generating enzyme required for sulfatase activity